MMHLNPYDAVVLVLISWMLLVVEVYFACPCLCPSLLQVLFLIRVIELILSQRGASAKRFHVVAIFVHC